MNILKTIEGERKKVSYLTGGGGIPAQCIAGNIYERSIIIILVTLAPRFCHFLPEESSELRSQKKEDFSKATCRAQNYVREPLSCQKKLKPLVPNISKYTRSYEF